jgi:antitoxin PrlF
MITSTVTSKGQTTIPKEIRQYLNLQSGDVLNFIIDSAGRVTLIAATIEASELKGILSAPKKRVSLAQMKKTIRMRSVKKCLG